MIECVALGNLFRKVLDACHCSNAHWPSNSTRQLDDEILALTFHYIRKADNSTFSVKEMAKRHKST